VNLGLRVPESWAHAQFDIPQSGETTERLLVPSQNYSANTPADLNAQQPDREVAMHTAAAKNTTTPRCIPVARK